MLTRHIRRQLRRSGLLALVVRARAFSDEVRIAEQVIDDSGIAPRLEQLLDDARTNGAGRPRELPVRALLVALLVLAVAGQPLHLRRVCELVNHLEPQVRSRLGLQRPDGRLVTERQVVYLFTRIRQELDSTSEDAAELLGEELCDQRQQLLQQLTDQLLAATVPDQRDSGSYALDATTVPAWARGRRSTHAWTDPDAGWSVKTRSGSTSLDTDGGQRRPRGAKAVFGYDLHLLTWVRDDDQTDQAPAVVEKMRLFGGGRSTIDTVTDMARTAFTDPAADQPVGGELLVDRWYTQHRPEDFAWPLRRTGANIVMDLKSTQAGPDGHYRGGLKVDGCLYCPALPEGLHELPPTDFRNARQVQQRATVAERRDPYRMLPLAMPGDDLRQRMQCPAERGLVRCSHKPDSLATSPADVPTVYDPPDAPGDFCTQRTVTVPPHALGGLTQKHPFGTSAWVRSYDRRNVVEGAAGVLKDAGGIGIKRDHIRVMGLPGVTLMLAIAVAAMNVRALAKHIARTDDADQGDDQQSDDERDDELDRLEAAFHAAPDVGGQRAGGADPPQVA